MIKWNGVVHNLHANYHAVTAGELYHVAMHKYCAFCVRRQLQRQRCVILKPFHQF